jgi:hypothetical protein
MLPFRWARKKCGSCTALAAIALGNHLMACRLSVGTRPEAPFMEVHGVRLHDSDRGEGRPIVLIRGTA